MQSNRLVGTWRLHSWKLIGSNGESFYPFGEKPQGYLCYMDNKFMSVHLMTNDRKPLDSENVFEFSPEEAFSMMHTYHSYCGQYDIIDNEVHHHIELVSIPNRIGTTQIRKFSLEDNCLRLTHFLLHEGENKHSELIWKRLDG